MSVIIGSIQIAKKTKVAWDTQAPVLLSGQAVAETDAGKTRIKVGDGTTGWAALKYITVKDSDEVIEGVANLYHTTARVRAAFSAGNGIGISSGSIALNATITGLTSVTSTSFIGALTGNASTATLAANSTLWGGAAYGGPYLPLTAGSTKSLTGDLYITATNPLVRIFRSTATNEAGILFSTTATGLSNWSLGLGSGGADSKFYLYNYWTAANAITVDNANSNVTFSGALTGTSATFSGDIKSNSSASDGQVVLSKMGGDNLGGGTYYAGDNGASQSGFRIGMKYGSSTSALAFDYSTTTQAYGSNPTGLTFAEAFRIRLSDGAATFSGTVTTPALVTTGSTGVLKVSSTSDAYKYDMNQFYPAIDNTKALGLTSLRFSNIYSVLGTFSSLGTGTVYSNAGLLTNTNPSDRTLKNTITSLKYGLAEIMQLMPKSFYYNSDTERASLKYGFIAQDVQSIMPDMVRKISPDGDKLGLESDGIYVTLVKAIQELNAKIEALTI